MRKYIFISLLITSIVTLNSCVSNPTSPSNNALTNTENYHQINIVQTDYQSFNIASNDNFILNSKNISLIILGNKSSGIFQGQDTSRAVYAPMGNQYKLIFNFHSNIDDTTLIYKLAIKYVLVNNSTYEFDTSKVTYKYPYKSTEIFIKWSKILLPPQINIQAFDIVDSMIYYHPYGSAGMFQYDMENNKATLKVNYLGGDYLAASPNYVFCDIYHNQIGRYNLVSDSLDLLKSLSPDFKLGIKGMDVYGNKLYVATDSGRIIVYNFDLKEEETIPYQIPNTYLAIKDGIAYSDNSHQIIGYNLTTHSYMNPVAPPSPKCDAIEIIGDKMFFSDYARQIICYVNLSDL